MSRTDWVVEIAAIAVAVVGFGKLLWDRAHYRPPWDGPAVPQTPDRVKRIQDAAIERAREDYPEAGDTILVRYKRIPYFPYVVVEEFDLRQESLTDSSKKD